MAVEGATTTDTLTPAFGPVGDDALAEGLQDDERELRRERMLELRRSLLAERAAREAADGGVEDPGTESGNAATSEDGAGSDTEANPGEEVSEHKISERYFLACLLGLGMNSSRAKTIIAFGYKNMIRWAISDGQIGMVRKLLSCSLFTVAATSRFGGLEPLKEEDFDFFIELSDDLDEDDIEDLVKKFQDLQDF